GPSLPQTPQATPSGPLSRAPPACKRLGRRRRFSRRKERRDCAPAVAVCGCGPRGRNQGPMPDLRLGIWGFFGHCDWWIEDFDVRSTGRLAVLLLLLFAVGTPCQGIAWIGEVRLGGRRGEVRLERANRRLHGTVIDYTHNHGADRRIWSAALCEK